MENKNITDGLNNNGLNNNGLNNNGLNNNAVTAYLNKIAPEKIDTGVLAVLANLTEISRICPGIAGSIVKELADQRTNLKLIASENYCSLKTQLTMGNWFTDKYAEGFPGHRFYAGCDNVDDIENYACTEAIKLFGAEHVYVQPHSGADANLIAYWAILCARVEAPALERFGVSDPNKLSKEDWNNLRNEIGNQRLLGMDYYSGGHLTHGYRHNISAQMFDAVTYGVNLKTGLIDYDELAKQARQVKPLILLAGYSAYPRAINFRKMREIADSVGAVLMVDMAHFAGLVAGKYYEGDFNPVPFAHVVTTTTHKTLRGPRGGLILCKKEFADYVNKGCPQVIGGPLPHVMAAKGLALKEANMPEFRTYAAKIVENARSLAACFMEMGMIIATGGTDNHLMLIDVRPFGLTGRQAESALRECGITLNRNSIPGDPNGPWYTSGLRIGTPAVTTLGMGREEMKEIAHVIHRILSNIEPQVIPGKNKKSKAKYNIDETIKQESKKRIMDLLSQYPVYPELDIEFLKKHFL